MIGTYDDIVCYCKKVKGVTTGKRERGTYPYQITGSSIYSECKCKINGEEIDIDNLIAYLMRPEIPKEMGINVRIPKAVYRWLETTGENLSKSANDAFLDSMAKSKGLTKEELINKILRGELE